MSAQEVSEGAVSVAEFDSAKESEIRIRANGGAPKKVFKFDSVFTPEDDQGKHVYENFQQSTFVISIG